MQLFLFLIFLFLLIVCPPLGFGLLLIVLAYKIFCK